ncbi:phosphoribosylanthranilate isomerase [Pontibacter ummariensis]|uniref:N-(5'-phosphoribosyl)anthranilate isomerase n=1 Tax=Pontibacter ummariensis TaxID=1610492 RepID=A0A239DG01_9BACT|nr:phosphoribosylanthranilate isomerase [Pontibacter ummariensis]PRY14407.1 phosphoribosylanthranilate isomerase [Pontibacter ummariensis]SNS31269.1 phosphoribosylanthranilate isomerase [Pontibacter ummariensis]
MKVRVKVCCISSIQEAQLAIGQGASAVGLVGEMPSGPGVIPDDRIREIVETVPPAIASFLLTSRTDAGAIIAHHRLVHANTIQLVDAVPEAAYAQLRQALPGVKLVQVIHVLGEESVAQAQQVAEKVDAILLDSGNPKLSVKELGGTGRIHDWVLSRKIRESIRKPVFLAGGLKAENVREAIEVVQPFGVDLCSGVRTNGHLDPYKLEKFFRAVEQA